jgi:hypothetical protein
MANDRVKTTRFTLATWIKIAGFAWFTCEAIDLNTYHTTSWCREFFKAICAENKLKVSTWKHAATMLVEALGYEAKSRAFYTDEIIGISQFM